MDSKTLGKRLASNSTKSNESNASNDDYPIIQDKKPAKKKKKHASSKHTLEAPIDLQKTIETAFTQIPATTIANFTYSSQELYSFFADTYGRKYKEVKTLAANHGMSNNIALAVILQEVYKHITSSDVKGRITRITKQLLLSENTPTEQENESSSNDNASNADSTQED